MQVIPSVSELTYDIKDILEARYRQVAVSGEVSDPKQASSGHLYFTLKDANASMACVAWRSTVQRQKLALVQGQQVILEGDVQVYAPRGSYQLIVSGVRQAGVGALQEAFEKLKRTLADEGLFDAERKKPLPSFPLRIGVVTSETGAAFQDIRSTLERRWPMARLILHPAAVQGAGAAAQIVAGIDYFRNHPVDVLIVGRGGGSLEDLWPFNEEAVARAIASCPVPVISAVGHETDFSISDFVADARAATPTQAVILATPDIRDLRFTVDERFRQLERVIRDRVHLRRQRMLGLPEAMRQLLRNRVLSHRNGTIRLHSKLSQVIMHRLRVYGDRHRSLAMVLEKHNPETPLALGYTRVMQSGRWIRAAADFNPDAMADLVWKDGSSHTNP
jgi:exodeoxyribonuclease VII large subunit